MKNRSATLRLQSLNNTILFHLSLCMVFIAAAATASLGQTPSPSPASDDTRRRTSRPAIQANSTSDAPATTEETTPPSGETTSNEPSSPDERFAQLRARITAARNDAERATARRALVDALIEAERRAEALAELSAMSLEDRFDPVYFYNIGNALARLGDSGGAVTAYRKAIDQRRGNYARAQNNLGVVLLRQARLDEAQEAFTSALRQENFTYAEASYNLGRLYVLRGEAGLAIREWQRTLRLDRTHADAAIALARLYVEDGDPRRAQAVLDLVTTTDEATRTRIAEARRSLGTVEAYRPSNTTTASATGNTTTSSAARTEGVTVDQPTYDLLGRARTAREAQRYEESIGLYRQVLAREANLAPALLELSFAQMSLRQHEEAIATLENLVRREPTRYPVAFYHLGRLYELRENLDAAARNFTRAAELYGDANPQSLVDVSRVRERQGDARGALDALEAYVAATTRLGHRPEWTTQKLAELRALATAGATPR
jgi:tetratricopeptide (TPR) repeat protein